MQLHETKRKQLMQIRKITTLAILAVALAMPAVSLAKNDKKAEKNETKNGIGAGGVPALRDYLQDQIDSALRRIRRLEHGLADTNARVDVLTGRVDDLEGDVADLDTRLEVLEGFFSDDDLDGFTEVEDDCDDTNAAVNPLAAEVPLNLIDDDCDHLIDEV
jgi:hypothetical protein